ncbi:MAG: two-component regulator propeller domain-containing protein [Candidatus Cryptobacteroides sp.]
MKKYLTVLVAVICLLAPASGKETGWPFFRFDHYTVEDGLSVNTVTSIIQDSRGFMWFGTSMGLNCYDGLSFKNFIPQDSDNPSKRANDVQCLTEGVYGELLVGTISGLFIFNPQTEKFSYFREETQSGGVTIESPVHATAVSQDGTVWVATRGQGVFSYDYYSKTLRQWRHNPFDEGSIPSDNVRNIFVDRDSRVWILTFDAGIACLDPYSGQCRRYLGWSDDPLERYDVMMEDSYGRLWLGNYSKGISRLDRDTGEFEHLLLPDSRGHVNHVRAIVEYWPSLLLLASDDGLTCFDTESGDTMTLTYSLSEISGINDSYVHSLFIDSEGSLWVGTYFGGINYSPYSSDDFKHWCPSSRRRYFPGKIVSVIRQDEGGDLWVGTDDSGVVRFNPDKGGVIAHYLPDGSVNSLAYKNIHALLCDGDRVWIGTYSKGLDRLDTRSGRFRHYSGPASGLPDESVYALLKDSDGNIWAGTPKGAGIYNPASDRFATVPETSGADIISIIEDTYGFIWMSSFNMGVFRYEPAAGRWTRYCEEAEGQAFLATDNIRTVTCDSNGRLIVGTDGFGLYLFDYGSGSFSPVDIPESENSTVNAVLSSGNWTWVSTNSGLLRINLRSGDVKQYSTDDGLQSKQFCLNAALKAADGTLWFGGIDGMNSFLPDALHENTSIPGIYITGLRLFNKRIQCGDDSGILDKAVSYRQDITLRHDQSVVSFEFVSLSYVAPEKNRYAYMLEGFDRDWTYVDRVPSGGVTYTNLPHGEYVFRVKGSNSDNLWNNTGTSLRIKVQPPWWQTTMAYVFYTILAISLFVIAIRAYVLRIEKQHEENIRELNAKKEKDIYDIKINFYTSIIHELRTPLTLIISPLEHIINKPGKKVSEVRDDLAIIQRNSRRLLTLVNQLMDFRKVEVKTADVQDSSSVNVLMVCRQVFNTFVPMAGQKNLDLVFDSKAGSLWMQSNTDSLTKLVGNLMSNALKFAHSRIRLSLEREGDMLRIICDDDGPGVPEGEREKIFEPFYQIESNQPTDYIGTGVGLSLVKSLVDRMEGTVSVDESPWGGARFVIGLPVVETEPVSEVPDEDIARAPVADAENELPDPDNQSARLLIVDDNRDMLSFLRGKFSDYWQVTVCSNAQDALKLCREHEFDIIISDVMMPDIDGTELCRRIKSDIDTCHIPVILLTAKVDTDSKIRGLECGADAYVEKPFSIDFLKAQIQSLLVNRRKVYDAFSREPVVNVASLVTNRQDLEFIGKVDEFIEANLNETTFTASDIAKHVGMSRSAFFSKLRAVSGQTPSDYVRLLRLRKAVDYFNQGETRINEVCYITGFNSPSYFTKCFVRQFGMTPKDYIRKLHSEDAPAGGEPQ